MKKILVILTILFLSISNTFAYSLTDKDNLLLSKINKKIDLIYKKAPSKIEKLGEKIDKILPKLKKDSRNYILIEKLGEHIKKLTLKPKINENTKKLSFINKNKKEEISLTNDEKEIVNQIKELIKKLEENKNYSSSNTDLIFTRTKLEENFVNLINKNIKNEKLFKYLNLSKEDLINFNIDYLNDQLEIANITGTTENYEKAQNIIKNINRTFGKINNKEIRKNIAKKTIEIGKIVGERKAILINTLTNTNINQKYYFEKGDYIGTVTYYGDSNFFITLKGDNFEYKDLLVNEIGNIINFKFPIKIDKSGFYYFIVEYGDNPGKLKFNMKIKKINK